MAINNGKLIKLVRRQQCLYDKRCSKFKDLKQKEKVWEEIGAQLMATAKDCKVRWRTLRDRFRKEKMANDCPSGSGRKVGAPWKYTELMSFLNDSLEPANTTGNGCEEVFFVEDETQSSTSIPSNAKRKHEELITDVLVSIKKKYQSQSSSQSKYANFVALMCEKFDRLPQEDVDELQVNFLHTINARINQKNQ